MNPGKILRSLQVSFVSTYPPQKCGIATFCSDLLNNMKMMNGSGEKSSETGEFEVVAMNKAGNIFNYEREVAFNIREKHRADYHHAADYINHSQVDVVSVQHEFGIFGGEDGNYINYLLAGLKKPAVTTLHTILEKPSKGQKKTLISICEQSVFVVVMTQKAINILQEVYNVPEEKILFIPHGTPDIPFLDSSYYKDQFQAEERKILLTFGLLSPSKGLEYAIEAMEQVVEKHPEALYIILGTTHPEVKRLYGEEYRHTLEKMVRQKELSQNVTFYDQYVTLERLVQFLVATDIYITPYLNRDQITSGTLAYALACGKAIISTPYIYAEELLANGSGSLVPFRDSKALSEQINLLLSDETKRNRMRKMSYQNGRQMIWKEVSRQYALAFEKARFNYSEMVNLTAYHEKKKERLVFPDVNLKHLKALTDDTGIFQHAVFNVPNRTHGYCTDDNARALIASVMNWRLFKDESIYPLIVTYMSCLHHAFDEKKLRMRNFMSYDRSWLEDIGSEDSHGRTLWALGYTIAHPPDEALPSLSTRLFKSMIGITLTFTSPRAWSFAIIGASYYLRRFGGDAQVMKIVSNLSAKLVKLYDNCAGDGWCWFEEIVAYENARISQALIVAGELLGDEKLFDRGLKSLQWLTDVQTNPDTGNLSLVGNDGWYKKNGEKALFDQQPVETAALVDAYYQLFTITGDEHWLRKMEWAFNWFLGSNDVHQSLYNFSSGSCYDGLQPGGINLNQGAESLLAFLLSLQNMHLVAHKGLFQPQLKLSRQNNMLE